MSEMRLFWTVSVLPLRPLLFGDASIDPSIARLRRRYVDRLPPTPTPVLSVVIDSNFARCAEIPASYVKGLCAWAAAVNVVAAARMERVFFIGPCRWENSSNIMAR